jgi:hypothetical protein
MKARVYDVVRLLVDVPAEYRDRVLPRGSVGTVVEAYEHPREGYAVDFAVPDDRLVGGNSWENVMLKPDQFEVVTHYSQADATG